MRKINTSKFVRATRTTPREINRQIVLNLVLEHQPVSRAEISRRMGIGRGMVTSIVDELLAERSIYEGTSAEAPRGRKPKMLFIRTRDRLAIAVDIRFSRTYLMLSDFSGTPLALEAFETVPDPRSLTKRITGRIARILRTHDAARRSEGVGVVVPGMVDHGTGIVLNAPQLGWRDVDLRGLLERELDLPVRIENAPIACALAQMWLVGQRGSGHNGDFVYVTIGDGVGAGVVVNGEVVRGHNYTAGEFGHVPLNVDGPRCLCGANGCLEAYTSNLATLSRYLGQPLSPVTTRKLLRQTGLTVEDVIERARAGDQRALDSVEETARFLGIGIGGIINALNPSTVYVGGEITALWEQLFPIMRREIEKRALTKATAATPIMPQSVGDHPRLRGATTLVAAPLFAAPRVA